MSEVTPLLEVAGVSKVFGAPGPQARRSIRAVDRVSFSMPGDRPTLLTLVGESGSGKTTIARMILALLRPTEGEIRFRGRDVFRLSGEDRSDYRRRVQAVFQDPYGTYNPFYRIERVLQVPIRKFGLTRSGESEGQLIQGALRAVDLRPGDVIGRYPHQLSGGERQRMMLARIYLMRPELIVADEPVSMVDVSLRAGFLNILLDFEREHGISCLFITHDLATAHYLGGQIMILCQGRVIEAGTMDQVVHEPKHPYTQLLIASVPPSEPRSRWQEELDIAPQVRRRTLELQTACVYRDRCPRAWGVCENVPPDVHEVGCGHLVACHLYA